MKNNIDLSEEKLDDFASAAVQYNIERQLRIRYDKLLTEQQLKSRKSASIFRFSSLAKVAAIAITVLGSIFLLRTITTAPSAQVMAQTLLEQTHISSNPDITRKGVNQADQTRRAANDAFTLKNYALAITKYETLTSQNDSTALDKFYLGICYLKINNYATAIGIFSEVKASKHIEEIDWLLSLTYVLAGEEENAHPLLQTIIAKQQYKHKEAKTLLRKID